MSFSICAFDVSLVLAFAVWHCVGSIFEYPGLKG
jgi:hypothetical protein